ncbi:hypothetical protein KGQ19_40635 [Catenulispora sp. NL8]|uniref:Uncharacterized protein n=1 Tax=Catenulispora pinistramenti TaxID=2705254 RepID=A0ABS5L4D6_9ACTN|nr:hypothetical protein [Catenulispora pinistramenti]MBS2553179.1 hypothetical protein [Catenulispora pinistramenti]
MPAPQFRVPLGAGHAELHRDGAPARFRHPAAPEHPWLLDEAGDPWHTAEHRWGSGFVLSDRGSGRWNAPLGGEISTATEERRYQPIPDLSLTVTREVGAGTGAGTVAAESLTETYTWTNIGDAPLAIGTLGLVLPLRDVYDSAEDALARACHAHVWTGGAWSWIAAQPMSGDGPVLGIIVRTGALWSYSIESRNHVMGSNVRGHLVVHPTDRARNPAALGGQPEITLAPGERYRLAWEVSFFKDFSELLAATDAPAYLDRLAAPVGEQIRIRPADDGPPDLVMAGTEHGIVHVDLPGGSRTAVFFHTPLRELVEARADYILKNQRAVDRAEPHRWAFTAYDTATGLRQTIAAWPDWSDGAERIAMPTLLQQLRLRGWGDAAVIDEALDGWSRFARAALITDDGDVLWGSDTTVDRIRLYNFPWLAHFFADQYVLRQRPEDLETAAALLERSYERGAAKHLSIGQPEAVLHVAELLHTAGSPARAEALLARLRAGAEYFTDIGEALPGHEVNYEQSMVAPLVSLLAIAARHWPSPELDAALERSVRWMRAFSGPQPHVRLRGIGIRHWDGYWFGRDRQWGDVFPHHWSVLNAVALTQLPEPALAEADAIFRANLVNFGADGSASCAFVFPSCVDGRPAHHADPLANDQDWILTLWLRTGVER